MRLRSWRLPYMLTELGQGGIEVGGHITGTLGDAVIESIETAPEGVLVGIRSIGDGSSSRWLFANGGYGRLAEEPKAKPAAKGSTQ